MRNSRTQAFQCCIECTNKLLCTKICSWLHCIIQFFDSASTLECRVYNKKIGLSLPYCSWCGNRCSNGFRNAAKKIATQRVRVPGFVALSEQDSVLFFSPREKHLSVRVSWNCVWVLDVSPSVGRTPGEPEESKSTQEHYIWRPYRCTQYICLHICCSAGFDDLG